MLMMSMDISGGTLKVEAKPIGFPHAANAEGTEPATDPEED